MTKSFLLSCCFLIATASALAQRFPMDQFMGVNLRREDPIERLKCVGFVREYHDWAVDEGNFYSQTPSYPNYPLPGNKYAWNFRQGTSVKFDDFYSDMLSNLNYTAGNRPPICATIQQCLPYLAGGDALGSFSEIKPVRSSNSGRSARLTIDNNTALTFNWHHPWDSTSSYAWLADYIYQFTRRYGANSTPLVDYPKLKSFNNVPETPRTGLNRVGYVELWNEPNKYWIRNYNNSTDPSWLNATQFTGAEYAAMASATYDAHNNATNRDSVRVSTDAGIRYHPSKQAADANMKFVMGGSAGIREYDWNFLLDMKTWFDNNRTGFPKKYPFDVINFHHYNSNQWFGVRGLESLTDYAASPEEDRWQLGDRDHINYSAATTATGYEPEARAPNYNGTNPQNSTQRTFKQRLVELRHRVDSLFGIGNVELWMSEFGFDTNEKSPYKAPTVSNNGVVVADQQEMQGRFLVRTYLEIAAAKWDRAIQFGLRDRQTSEGVLFDGSGLLKDRANEFAPKKAYYYVYTMKEALKGTQFTEEIKVAGDPTFTTTGLFAGHSYWYQDTRFPRISRFAKPGGNAGNAGEVVYATWLPTKTNAQERGVKIYLAPVDAATAALATMVTMEVGDVNGKRTRLTVNTDPLNGQKYVTIPVLTEAPTFIRLGESYSDDPVEQPRVTESYGVSCDAIRVKLGTPLPQSSSLRIYYYERPMSEWLTTWQPNSVLPLNDPFLKQYAENVKLNDFVISNLKLAHNMYIIYVQTVDASGNVSAPVEFLSETTDCFKNAILKNKMIGSQPAVLDQLFDYGRIDFCYPLRTKPAPDGNLNYYYLNEWNSSTDDILEIDLRENITSSVNVNYYLDAISILGGTNAGTFEVQYWDAASGRYKTWVKYLKDGFDEWKTFVGLPVGVFRLRFIKEKNMGIRKIILKGRPETDTTFVRTCCDGRTISNSVSYEVNRIGGALPANSFSGSALVRNTVFTIDQNYTFASGATVTLEGSNASIVVNNGATLTMEGTNLKGCNNSMHQGIIVQPGGKLIVNNSEIRDGFKGVQIRTGATPTEFRLANTILEENLIGLSVTDTGTIHPNSSISSCIFDGNFRDLKGYGSLTLSTGTFRSSIGAIFDHATLATIGFNTGEPNRFNDLAIGIDARSSVLTMRNTYFSNIRSKIQPSDYGNFAFGGMAIQAIESKINFKGKGGKDAPAVFNKVQRGLYSYYGDFEVDSAHFHGTGEFAVQGIYGNGGDSKLTNSYVKANQTGKMSKALPCFPLERLRMPPFDGINCISIAMTKMKMRIIQGFEPPYWKIPPLHAITSKALRIQ